MVIADVRKIFGFIPVKQTVKMLELSSHTSSTEERKNDVLTYVEQVTNQTLSFFAFALLEDSPETCC